MNFCLCYSNGDLTSVSSTAYPMGLPEWDTVHLTIQGVEGLDGTAAGQEILDPDTAEVWIASKCLDRSPGRTVADRLGRNEKTKVYSQPFPLFTLFSSHE
mmetsp:Transcript_11880/g.17962  ORF Transcript_11880/g.17962 Transcript_11880/m.17962 type:complete len:100 (+) Transcript_11880:476-775(+)